MGESSPLRELLALFEIRVDDKQLEEANKKVESFTRQLQQAGTVILEALAVREVTEFFEKQVEWAAHLSLVSERIGVTADSLRAFALAARMDVDEAAHSFTRLQQRIGTAMVQGGDAAKVFNKLGIQLKAGGQARPFEEVLGDIAEKFSKLPDAETRAAYGMQLFGRGWQRMAPLLMQGRAGLEEARKAADRLGSGLGKDFYERAKLAHEQSERFAFGLQSLKQRILDVALGGLLVLGNWLEHTVERVLDLTKKTTVLQTLMTSIAVVSGVKLLTTLTKLARTFGLLKGSITETLLSLLKFAAPLAIITSLYLIFDDLYALMKGGDSVIGDLLEQMGGLEARKKFVEDMAGSWRQVKAIWEDSRKPLAEILETLVKGIPDAMRVIINLAQIMRAAFHLVAGTGETIGNLVFQATHPNQTSIGSHTEQDYDKFVNQFTKDINAIGDVWKSRPSGGTDMTRTPAGFVGPPAPGQEITPPQTLPPQFMGPPNVGQERVPLAMRGHSTTVHMQQTNHATIEVNGPTDKPDALGKAMAQAVGPGVATDTQIALNEALAAVPQR